MRCVAERFASLRLTVMAVVLVLALSGFRGVSAQEPPQLRGRITDLADVLDDRAGVEEAIQQLEDSNGVQLWVLLVDTTGTSSVTDFVDSVASANSFGGNDALVVVAMEDRTDALWLGPLLDEVTDQEIDRLLANELEPALAAGDVSEGLRTLAAALGEAAGGEPANGGDGNGGSGGGFPVIAGILIAVAVGVVVVVLVRRRMRTRVARGVRDQKTGDLEKRAGSLLVETDDELREAEQELGFAEAQFDEPDVARFRAALKRAQEELKAAFALQQQLDDNEPEPPAARQKMLEELVSRAETAQSLLAVERDHIEKLRDLERTAPAILAALPTQVSEVEARLPKAEAGIRSLQVFAEALWRPLDGNVVEARKRLDFAREAAGQSHGSPREVAAAARAGQGALTEAVALLDAIDRQVAAVEEARGALTAEIAAAEADVRAARSAMPSARGPELREALARAEAQLETARREAASARPDVLSAIRSAQEANRGADAILENVREATEQQAREVAAYRATAGRAETAYRQASDYISARRGSIGREARTRLVEAERRLASARQLEARDLPRAMSEAESAERLATEAMRLAENEFEQQTRRPTASTGRSRGGGDLAGSILGGAIGSILAGGMRGSSGTGFGGTNWGSPSKGNSSGGNFKLPTPGGGGRSRGGRW